MIDDVAAFLVSKGITGVSALGTDLFINWMPEKPDTLTVLTETAGRTPYYLMGGATPVESPGFQVRCRGPIAGAAETRDRIRSIWDALVNLSGATLNGHAYINIEAADSVAYLGRDVNSRPEYVANFMVIV